jgi:hypothetical protein
VLPVNDGLKEIAKNLIANQVTKEMEDMSIDGQMKEIRIGNEKVIDKYNKEIQKNEQEVDHEYESGAMKSVAKAALN